MGYNVRRLYHADILVPDLDEADRFFAKVFGRESFTLPRWANVDESALDPSYPVDYCRFTPIAEVLVESIDPTRHLVHGIQPHPAVSQPHLASVAWFMDGVEDLWREFRSRGMTTMDLARREPADDGPPRDVANIPIVFSASSDTGLEYEFCAFLEHREPRGEPPPPAIIADDPLGIQRCSHHTILTDQLDRALRLYLEILGGRIIHEGRNDVLETQSTYVALADGIFELAQPLEDGSPAKLEWQRSAPDDTYYQLTWQVADLEQVTDHLKSCGIGFLNTEGVVITDPIHALGVRFGFTSQLTPGDLRV